MKNIVEKMVEIVSFYNVYSTSNCITQIVIREFYNIFLVALTVLPLREMLEQIFEQLGMLRAFPTST